MLFTMVSNLLRTIIFIFLLIVAKTSFSIAVELNEGDFVSGSINNLYGMKINVTLPDGRWEITDSKQDGDYRDIELYSEKYEAWAYIYTPTNEISGERWTNELQNAAAIMYFYL